MRLSNITDILKKNQFFTGVPLLGKIQDPPLQSTFRNHQGLVGFAKGDSKCTVLLSGEGCLGVGN